MARPGPVSSDSVMVESFPVNVPTMPAAVTSSFPACSMAGSKVVSSCDRMLKLSWNCASGPAVMMTTTRS